MTDSVAIYDAAEMRDGKGFSVEGHRAGIAAVVADAKAEAWDEGASLVAEQDRVENPYRAVGREGGAVAVCETCGVTFKVQPGDTIEHDDASGRFRHRTRRASGQEGSQ